MELWETRFASISRCKCNGHVTRYTWYWFWFWFCETLWEKLVVVWKLLYEKCAYHDICIRACHDICMSWFIMMFIMIAVNSQVAHGYKQMEEWHWHIHQHKRSDKTLMFCKNDKSSIRLPRTSIHHALLTPHCSWASLHFVFMLYIDYCHALWSLLFALWKSDIDIYINIKDQTKQLNPNFYLYLNKMHPRFA